MGGHCIPCDPYYLLRPLQAMGVGAPITEQAMSQIAGRPLRVADRAAELLAQCGHGGGGRPRAGGGRGLQVGRERHPRLAGRSRSSASSRRAARRSPTTTRWCRACGAASDPKLVGVAQPRGADYDLVILTLLQPDADYAWLADCEHVLDCTYRTPAGRQRSLL